jgi:hypothetical protein
MHIDQFWHASKQGSKQAAAGTALLSPLRITKVNAHMLNVF